MINQGNSQSGDVIHPVIIIGSGPAGLSAALYAARAELSPILITGMEFGGQAATTNVIENYPGFPDGIGGVELGGLFQKQAERFGASIVYDVVSEVDFHKKPYEITTYNQKYLAHSVIIATGARPNHLNVPGEIEFTGKGVSYCATCDGWFFKDKRVVVVGGGDSALEEGLFLTRYATSVTIIHRRDSLRAGAILQSRAKSNPKIHFIWDTVVEEIIGENAVTSVQLKNLKTNEKRILETEGVFVFIGHTPNTELFKGQIHLDANGYIVVDNHMRTSLEGVFAAGEAADSRYRQVITSAGMGAAAAIEATHYIESLAE